MTLPVAFSPCPNDTFLFYAWVNGLVGQEYPITPTLADVQQLNEWSKQAKYPLCKVSIQCLGHILNDYVLLPSGCALGRGCGPKIIALKTFDLSQLDGKRIAIPGKDTTAHLLLNVLATGPTEKVFCTYEQVPSLIQSGRVDCGLIIHESRFTFQQQGFLEIADLGVLWENTYHLPLPLGGIVAKRSLGPVVLNDLSRILQESLKTAQAAPHCALPYILEHSIEKDVQVVNGHIDLYVNEETACLSEEGCAAIDQLLTLGKEQHLIPRYAHDWLFDQKEIHQTC